MWIDGVIRHLSRSKIRYICVHTGWTACISFLGFIHWWIGFCIWPVSGHNQDKCWFVLNFIPQHGLQCNCQPCTVRCRYNAVNFLKTSHKRHTIIRPLGQDIVFFYIQSLIYYSAPIAAVIYAISCFIGPRYNGTQLYIVLCLISQIIKKWCIYVSVNKTEIVRNNGLPPVRRVSTIEPILIIINQTPGGKF